MPKPDQYRAEKAHVPGRTPPNHLEAERAVLGAMMLSEDCLHDVLEILMPDDFYAPVNRKIFEIMKSLAPLGQPVDNVLVYEAFLKKGSAEEIGGAVYLSELTEDVPTLSNATYYAKIVKEKGLLRRLLELTMEVQEKVFDQDAEMAFEVAESQLTKLAESRVTQNSADIGSLMEKAFSDFNSRLAGEDESKGLTCQYPALIKLLNGFRGGEMLIVAARPSMGKTSFTLNLMLDMAVRQQAPAVLFSLEMGAVQIANNMICMESCTDGNFWRNPSAAISGQEADRIQNAMDRIGRSGLIIDDESVLTPTILRSKLRRYVREHKIAIVFIDYLQLMTAPEVGSREGRTQEMSHISRTLKAISRELDVPIVALAQLNRAVESRAGNKPKMADLRESGSIEQDADAIMLIHRPDYYNEEERPGEADIILAKNRNGATGTVPLSFVKNMMRFETLNS
ncbi:MAG: replicative DNA helicase [Planctomycetes bacterium]|nr:replicative DNA helicase [Planctomycetota bacterium]